MKRFFLLTILVLMTLSYLTVAQLTQPYTAKEGEQVTRNKAAETLTNPELFLIATIAGQFEGIPIELDFDEETGEATAWIYMYEGSIDGNDTSLTYVALKTVLGISALEINMGEYGTIPFNPETGIDDVEWIDSDKMMEAVKNNSNYKDFLDVFPETEFTMGTLLNEPVQDATLWFVVFMNKDSTRLTCMVDAVTSETVCRAMQTDVKVKTETASMNIYPNPVSELAVLSIPLEYIDDSANLKIFDANGNLILERTNLDISSDGQIALGLGDFPQGVYNLLYLTKGKILSTKFVVVK